MIRTTALKDLRRLKGMKHKAKQTRIHCSAIIVAMISIDPGGFAVWQRRGRPSAPDLLNWISFFCLLSFCLQVYGAKREIESGSAHEGEGEGDT